MGERAASRLTGAPAWVTSARAMWGIRHLVYFVAAIALLAAQSGLASETASLRLERLAHEAYERSLDLFPVGETMGRGAGPRQDRLELTFTTEHRGRQRTYHRWVLEELDRIAPDELQPREKLTHRLLGYRSRQALEWLGHPFHRHYLLIHLDGGIANNLIRLVGRQPFRNEADYRAWLKRMQRYPRLLDGAARVLRDGIKTGITIPRAILERSLPQLKGLAPDGAEVEASTLWRPITRFPESVNAAARERIEAEYRKLLVEEIFPAIRRLAAFVETEYLPHARTTDGIGALPDGETMYRLAVRSQTTTDLTAGQIHELGLKEVARIQPLLLEAGMRAGFKGPVSDLRRWLAANPENFPFATGEQVIEYLNRLHTRIVPQLPRLFGRLPKARFEIRLTDPAIAASMPAQWYPPSDDGTRPGVFAIPVVNPRNRSTFGLASLLAHEGMPGHHLEGGIRLENPMPALRRRMWINAFGEGWALYAESLGHELGLYDEPLALMGRYAAELYRACRLVVDTGLHAMNWPRQRAMRYLVEQCGSTQGGATNAVLRYMAWPGQALGYKLGELAIRDIRAQAERRLGVRFDIRAFHDAFLAEGHLPLGIARERMEAWIEDQAGK